MGERGSLTNNRRCLRTRGRDSVEHEGGRAVATAQVSDYLPLKFGQLLVQLRDDDFLAQAQQAEAGVASGQDRLIDRQTPVGCDRQAILT